METTHVYHYLKIGRLLDLVVTDNREIAKQDIQRGYRIFTVPQMFGTESGVFTLYLEDQNQTANRMSIESADRVLTEFEESIRAWYSVQSDR